MEEHDAIIVIRKFETAINANLAKTKLDAYGIPCFLTEENISNLYPGQSILSFTVRLHVFDRDKFRAEQILQEDKTEVVDENDIRCPKCQSARVERVFPKSLQESLKIILFGVLFPHKKINHCMDCDNEF